MKKKIFTLFAIFAFSISALVSEASHFRYGHITWTRVPNTRNVTFTITTAWRFDSSLGEAINFDFGDGTTTYNPNGGTLILNVPNDYRVFQLQLTHTYSTDGPFTASFFDCCRVSTLQNGADQDFWVSTNVCLSNNNLGSPAYNAPVMIDMGVGGQNQFQLVTSDPDGSPITYSTTAIQGSSYVPSVGSNTASVSPTGLISWNTTGAALGQLYQMKITMSDGCARSEIDFIIKISYCPLSYILSGTQSINQGQTANLSLTINGSLPPWTYRLSGTNADVTTSTSPVIIPVTPSNTTLYSITSLSNSCSSVSPSGSVTVTVNNPVSLVSCLPLNGNTNDQAGGNNGTVYTNGGSNSYTTNRNAISTSALSISNGAYVELPTTNLLNNYFTHSMWVSPSSLPTSGNNNYLLSIGGIGQSQDLYLENASGVINWVFKSSVNTGVVELRYPANIVTGQWYHAAIIKSSSALQLCVNGVIVAATSANGLTSSYPSSSTLRLGTQSSGLVNFFNGKIDDVRLFRGALSSSEIASLYNSTLDCPAVTGVPTISLTNIANTSLCRNQTSSVNFQQSSVTAGSTYTVQLSSASGSFMNPTNIGVGTVAPISVNIPNTITTAGTGYLVRIINGSLISVNTLPVTILPTATGVISGTATIDAGLSTNLTINLTGTSPWTYSISNGLTTISYTSTIATVTQSVSPSTSTTYTLSAVADNTCGVGTFSGNATVTIVPALQLLACYKFDGNALDSKGSNHGTVNGATLTTDRFGKANAAYNFNGTSNYISIPGASLASSEYTYAAWVNTNNLTDFSQTIVSIGWLGADQVLALSNTTGTTPNWNFASYIYFAALPIPQILSTTGVTANKWHFVVATRSLNTLKLYINGQIVGTASSTGVPPLYSTPIAGAIGARSRADIQFFNGKIDDVKIYKGILKDEEVLLLYNEEQGECSSPCSGMIYSLSSGSWNTSATWSCGRIPDFTDKVLIKAGHTVTISTNDAKAKKLVNNGQVLFANTTSKLVFGGI